MSKDITTATTASATTIGIDLGDRWSEICVLDAAGECEERLRLRTEREALRAGLARHRGARAVIEAGTHSPWVSRVLTECGFETIVANPRRVRLIAESASKDDGVDAETLARLGRIDARLLSPIRHRGEQSQRDLVRIRSRDVLVRARTQLINAARGLAKALGDRLPACSAESFARRMRADGATDRYPGFGSLVETIEHLTREIRELEREIDRVGREQYPETARLRAVPGVGAITALCFVLVLEDPSRFGSSRSVGAYLGLRPRRRDSGASRPQLAITKQGDVLLRRLLVGSAHYLLGPFGPPTDLRHFGLRLAASGGPAAKKRAVVAVARKLAVLLHRLWLTGEPYVAEGYATSRRRTA